MQPFLYVVFLKPTETEAFDGKAPQIIVPLGVVMAKTKEQAILLAGRHVPQEHLHKLDRIEVAVRPF